jgi:hypothetical protein
VSGFYDLKGVLDDLTDSLKAKLWAIYYTSDLQRSTYSDNEKLLLWIFVDILTLATSKKGKSWRTRACVVLKSGALTCSL